MRRLLAALLFLAPMAAHAASADLRAPIPTISGDIVALHAMLHMNAAHTLAGKPPPTSPIFVTLGRMTGHLELTILGKGSSDGDAKSELEAFRKGVLPSLMRLTGKSVGIRLEEDDFTLIYVAAKDDREIGRWEGGSYTAFRP